jgi:hypothetical protein
LSDGGSEAAFPPAEYGSKAGEPNVGGGIADEGGTTAEPCGGYTPDEYSVPDVFGKLTTGWAEQGVTDMTTTAPTATAITSWVRNRPMTGSEKRHADDTQIRIRQGGVKYQRRPGRSREIQVTPPSGGVWHGLLVGRAGERSGPQPKGDAPDAVALDAPALPAGKSGRLAMHVSYVLIEKSIPIHRLLFARLGAVEKAARKCCQTHVSTS